MLKAKFADDIILKTGEKVKVVGFDEIEIEVANKYNSWWVKEEDIIKIL